MKTHQKTTDKVLLVIWQVRLSDAQKKEWIFSLKMLLNT